MIILFYSNECKFCSKLLDYINNNNLKSFFKLINIDELNEIPENITIVPTIVNSSIQATFEGKKAFEFITNQKFFEHPTNNIDFWLNNPIPKPTIEEDKLALDKLALERKIFSSTSLDKQNIEVDDTIKNIQITNLSNSVTTQPVIRDKKTASLLKLKKKI